MRTPWVAFVLIAGLVPFSAPALAQTSVALSGYGAFGGTTTGNGTQQSPANQAGGMFELRHISNPIFGFEATYSYNRANQTYSSAPGDEPAAACPSSGCGSSVETVRANAHEITADWVPSLGVANFRPFGVLGVGLLLDVPAESQATAYSSCPACPVGAPGTVLTTGPTSTSTRAIYVYGAGLDWGLLPHLGLRFQYRGNLYQAPNVTNLFSSTNAFTHTAEPMAGAYFSF